MIYRNCGFIVATEFLDTLYVATFNKKEIDFLTFTKTGGGIFEVLLFKIRCYFSE